MTEFSPEARREHTDADKWANWANELYCCDPQFAEIIVSSIVEQEFSDIIIPPQD